MSLVLRILLIVISVFTLVYFLSKIRKAEVQIEDSIFWIIASIVWILLGAFPQILTFVADSLGVQSPVNFLFLVALFFLIIKNFSLTLQISKLQSKLNSFGQRYAINEYTKEKANKE